MDCIQGDNAIFAVNLAFQRCTSGRLEIFGIPPRFPFLLFNAKNVVWSFCIPYHYQNSYQEVAIGGNGKQNFAECACGKSSGNRHVAFCSVHQETE